MMMQDDIIQTVSLYNFMLITLGLFERTGTGPEQEGNNESLSFLL